MDGSIAREPAGTEAEARWLDRVEEDVAELLGPGVQIRSISLALGADVILRCRYGLGSAETTTEVHGATLVEAHAELRRQVVEDRIGLALRAMYPAS